jgi:hypothetical protein
MAAPFASIKSLTDDVLVRISAVLPFMDTCGTLAVNPEADIVAANLQTGLHCASAGNARMTLRSGSHLKFRGLRLAAAALLQQRRWAGTNGGSGGAVI